MKNTKLIKTLTNLGLSDKEALVYLTSLSLGSTTILKIAKASELKRPTVYGVVDDLKKLGLMKIDLKGWKQYYTAEDPKHLDKIIEDRRKEFKQSLPDLESLYQAEGMDTVMKYYEGLDAIKNMFSDLLEESRPKDEFLIMSNSQKFLALDDDFFEKHIHLRAKKGINTKLLLQESEIGHQYQKIQSTMNMEIKFLPKETNLNSSIYVTPSKIIFLQPIAPIIAMVIENKNMIKTLEQIYKLLWNTI